MSAMHGLVDYDLWLSREPDNDAEPARDDDEPVDRWGLFCDTWWAICYEATNRGWETPSCSCGQCRTWNRGR